MSHVLHVWQAGYPWDVRVDKVSQALIAAGHAVTVLARRRAGEERTASVGSLEIERVGSAKWRQASVPLPYNPLWARAIERTARERSSRLILVRDLPLALPAAAAARRLGLPVVLDMAEHYPEAMRSWKKYSENPLLRLFVHDLKVPDAIERRAVARMDGIIVVCDEQAERLNRDYAYPLEKMEVVRNSTDLSKWTGFARGAHNAKPLCFGYHGILCEDRELEVVLKGFDLAAAGMRDIELLIAGGGESETELRALAKTLAHADRIRFTGRYTPEALPSLYGQTDFGVVSLRDNEFTRHTLANKFFDYAALGKPFIFPAIAPLTRVMAKMNCGVAFAPGSPEAVAEAMREIRRRDYSSMSMSGMTAIENEFNWSADTARLLEFVGRVAKL